MAASETMRLLRRPAYVRYLSVLTLARAAGTMFTVSGVLLLFERTHSLSLAGAVVAAATLPAALTGPLLGAWLDVAASRRRLIVLDRVVTLLALGALLALAGHVPGWVLPFVAVAYGATSPLSAGGFSAVLPELAGPQLIDVAYTFEASCVNVAFIVGPALAGAIVATAGAEAAIIVQMCIGAALTAVIAGDAIYELRPRDATPHERIRDAVREGFRSLWQIRALRANLVTFTVYVTAWGTLVVAFPAYALSVGARASAAGYMWAAIALGSMISAVALRVPALRIAPRVLVGGSLALMAASVAAWPLADGLAIALLLVLLTGLLDGPSFAALLAARQRATPAHLRGQIFSTATSVGMAASALGTAAAGPFRDQFGTTATLSAFAGLLLLTALLALGMGRTQDARPADAALRSEKLR
ncbi:MAG TPA: MFS transporter [Solirubrobacteraceae bacterium]|jgi:MFS family permease|nr:MFS transporter [Solirubrobacteraceae bacterium]